MIEKIKTGDKLTIIRVSDLASTTISEITIDSIQGGKIIFANRRQKYSLNINNGTLVLNGHNLGITKGTWNNGTTFLMDANCNIGGLDRESMITLLKTNINDTFNQWNRIHWFDGTSESGDPLFVSRPATYNYLKYRVEAEDNKSKTAQQINVDEFIYSYSKSSKHNDLTDMLRYHLDVDMESKESLGLGKVVDIVDMSEADFDALEYSSSKDFALKDKGGSRSEDIAEGRDKYNLSEFEIETFYCLCTLIRTPSGRAIIVDAQGHDYMRYTSLLPHYRVSMKDDCERVEGILSLEREEAEKERIKKKQEEARLEKIETARITKEYSYLTIVTDRYDNKSAAKNLRKVLKITFPQTKFSVTNNYSDSYYVSWTDGPTEDQVREITKLFKGEGYDSMRECSYKISSPFMSRYGAIGHASTSRTVSEQHRTEALDAINKELETSYVTSDYVSEREEYMSQLVHKRTYSTDYSPKLEVISTPTGKKKSNIPIIKAEGVEIFDYNEKSFAVIGETMAIKDTLKQLGGYFNSHLKCGAGWIFSKKKLEIVKQTLCIA